MTSERTRIRASVHELAGYDRMVPVHRKAFTEAVDKLAQSLVVGILEDLDKAKVKARSNEEESDLVSELMNDLATEHGIVWVRGGGYQPKPKDG